MKKYAGYITGSIPELDGEQLCITSLLVGKEGLLTSYRKIHVTDYEKRAFSAGNKTVIHKSPKRKLA